MGEKEKTVFLMRPKFVLENTDNQALICLPFSLKEW